MIRLLVYTAGLPRISREQYSADRASLVSTAFESAGKAAACILGFFLTAVGTEKSIHEIPVAVRRSQRGTAQAFCAIPSLGKDTSGYGGESNMFGGIDIITPVFEIGKVMPCNSNRWKPGCTKKLSISLLFTVNKSGKKAVLTAKPEGQKQYNLIDV